MHDEKELTEVLKNYQKKIIKNSEDVLKDLRKILEDLKQKKFERIHFHFSGKIHHAIHQGYCQALVLIPVPKPNNC